MTPAPHPATAADAPLVVHLLYRFDHGGLQTLLAELVERMPARRYRHAVVCLTDHTDAADRIRAAGAALYALHKPPGQGLATHARLWRLLRRLRPAAIHTYNIGTLEYSLTALLAGVPVRVHAEHGRDSVEIDGRHRKYNLLRRLLAPVVHAFVPVSPDLEGWLRDVVGIPARKIALLRNGVDTARFAPAAAAAAPQPVWIGTVGRADRIKNHAALLDAFELLAARFPACDLRLAIVGDGPLLPALRERVAARGWADRAWLPGARADIAAVMRGLSVFVLPSLSEATPVTILEAMATGLPVVASRVGGVPELVLAGRTGALVPPADSQALADAIAPYVADASLRARHGAAGRAHVQAAYSIDAMVAGYAALYDRCRSLPLPDNVHV